MPIVGFSFRKICLEKFSNPPAKLEINNNVAFSEVEKQEMPKGAKESAIKISYTFSANYRPNVADVTINGDVVFTDDGKEIESILKQWKKEKKLPNALMKDIINAVMVRCLVESVILTRDLNLPPPISLPVFTENLPEKQKEYIG